MNETKPTANAATTVVSTLSAARITGRSGRGRRRGARTATGSAGVRLPARWRRQRSAARAMPATAEQDARPGTSQAARSKPSSSGSASTSSPNSATRRALISSFERQSAISRSTSSRWRWACGASVASASGVPHTGHITSSSTSPSVVCGHCAAAAGAERAPARRAAAASARLTRPPRAAAAPRGGGTRRPPAPSPAAAIRPCRSITNVSG